MKTATSIDLMDVNDRLKADPTSLPVDLRLAAAKGAAEALLCRDALQRQTAMALAMCLASDPDWQVRLSVAQMLHLLDEESFQACTAILLEDTNRYVRQHARRQEQQFQRTRRERDQRHAGTMGPEALDRRYGRPMAQEIVRRSEERVAALITAMIHDQRGPLMTLRANLARLRVNSVRPEQVRSMEEDVATLERSLEAMAAFAQPLPDDRGPEDLWEMVQHATDRAKSTLEGLGLDLAAIEVRIDGEPRLQLRVQRSLFITALTNIIQNAIEAHAKRDQDRLEPGWVAIRLEVDGYVCRLHIQDNGLGIEPEVLKDLRTFVPKGRNHAKRQSSGWGLSLAHRYIVNQDGSLHIESTVDQGTTVTVTMPLKHHDQGDTP